MLKRGDGHGNVQGRALYREFHLDGGRPHSVGAAQQVLQFFEDIRWKHVTQLRADQHRRELRLLRRVEHAEQGLVDMTDTELRIERKNAGRYAFKDRFDVLPTLFQFRIGGGEFFAGGFELASVRGEFRRHLIEGFDKVPQFVGSGNLDAIIEITARNLLSCFSKSYDR